MQISITARHFNLTDAIKSHVEKSCENLFHYFDKIININVVISYKKERTTTEIHLHASKINIQSTAKNENLYKSIDEAVEKTENQLRKIREKITAHPNKKRAYNNKNLIFANLYQKDKNKDMSKIHIKTKKFYAATLSVDQAIETLENSSDFYCVFRNMESDRINVLIKKDDQHYKIISTY